jgi:NAD+ kinase
LRKYSRRFHEKEFFPEDVMQKAKRAIAIVNTYKPAALRIANEISSVLLAKGIQCDVYNYDGISVENPFDGYDFAITLGGDGTVLFAARYCSQKHIPVFPVNLGEFGFIAGIQPDAWRKPLSDYLEGRKNGNTRMLIRARVIRNGEEPFSSYALNDAVVSGNGIAKIVKLEVLFNGFSFGTYKADGVIVSTPTGSTAYSAASGGPILAPDLSAFVLSPICSFSLSNRPIVLPSSGTLQITVLGMRYKDSILTIDGQEMFPLHEGDSVLVDEAPDRVQLIGCDADVFYGALRSKLNWSGAPVPAGTVLAGDHDA